MLRAIHSLILAVIAIVSTLSAAAGTAAPQPVILRLNSVACASGSYCLAVGQDVTDDQNFAEVWDGAAWRIIAAPDPGSPEALWDVACYAPRRCLATGTYADSSGDGFALAASWDGTAWRLLDPASPGADTDLSGIACPAPSECVAVGTSLLTSYEPLVQWWNGRTWRVQATPSPGDSGALNAVACPAVNDCVAVGSRDSADGRPRTLAEAWNGVRWRILPAAALPTSFGNLIDVACSAPDMCVATGYLYARSTYAEQALSEKWNGRAWQVTRLSAPTGAGPMTGVACGPAPGGPGGPGTAACLAVGGTDGGGTDGGGRDRPLAESWNGSGWQALWPTYSPGSEATLTDVACPQPRMCMAVGDYDFTVGDLPMAETWNGRRWQLLSMPR